MYSSVGVEPQRFGICFDWWWGFSSPDPWCCVCPLPSSPNCIVYYTERRSYSYIALISVPVALASNIQSPLYLLRAHSIRAYTTTITFNTWERSTNSERQKAGANYNN